MTEQTFVYSFEKLDVWKLSRELNNYVYDVTDGFPYKEEKIAEYLRHRAEENKPYSIVVVAEGIKNPGKERSVAQYLSNRIYEMTGLETRETVLGYIQRGGTPSPADRILATQYGTAAADMIAKRDFGKMVALKKNEIVSVSLDEVAGRLKLIEPDDPLVVHTQNMGTSFGV